MKDLFEQLFQYYETSFARKADERSVNQNGESETKQDAGEILRAVDENRFRMA